MPTMKLLHTPTAPLGAAKTATLGVATTAPLRAVWTTAATPMERTGTIRLDLGVTTVQAQQAQTQTQTQIGRTVGTLTLPILTIKALR
jgi:hypothetical protein